MANFDLQKNQAIRKSYEQKYAASRMNLLLVVVCTLINIILLVTNTDTYFLFSAFIPYYIAGMGMLLCGRMPEDYYTGELAGIKFLDESVFYILLGVSIAFILLYVLAWFMSKKNRVGWLVFAIILFGLDTIVMLVNNGISLQSIFDIVFHILVFYYLVLGISAYYKLKELPIVEGEVLNQDEFLNENEEKIEEVVESFENSPILRKADMDVKHRVLLSARFLNYEICYRRVKHTNELVINGNVYDELNGVVEFAHTIQANINGHNIAAGYTGSYSIIAVDGEVIAKKFRLF